MSSQFKVETQFTLVNVIMNKWNRNQKVANFICLLTKQYIYSQRCLKKPLSWPGLREKICHVERVEKYIARKNGKIDAHINKWSPARTVTQEVTLDQYINDYIDLM